MRHYSYQFSKAITRSPSARAMHGLTTATLGPPDIDAMTKAHGDYVLALSEAGVDIVALPQAPEFPDSMFVEDTCLCFPEGAILMRPGAKERLGEVALIEPEIRAQFQQVKQIEGPGFVDGGDIMITEKAVLAGRSERTDQAGLSELADILSHWGHTLRQLETPPGVLHFKTDCSLLDHDTILSTPRLAQTGCFDGFKVIETGPGEEAAANSIRVNDFVIAPAGFDETANRLTSAGFKVKFVDNREFAKLDGGMSCLSLRY